MTAYQLPRSTDGLRHRAVALAGAAGAVGATGLAFAVFVGSTTGQGLDDAAMKRWAAAWGHDQATSGWLGDHQLALLAVIGALLAVICAARRARRLAAHAAVVVLGAVVAAVALKHGLDRPALGIGTAHNSFPSNTVAAFSAAALALVAVVPPRARAAVGLCAGVGVAAVSATVVALGWHRPSDVIGGLLIAAAVGLAAESVLPVRRR